MGFAWRPDLSKATPVPRRRGHRHYGATRTASPPPDIAFLREFGVASRVLETAAKRAQAEGVSAAQALLASGGVSDTLFFRSLAQHVGVPFVDDWPALSASGDPTAMLSRRRAFMSDSKRWLIAPTDRDIGLLVAVATRGDIQPPNITLTTPDHFDALVLRRAAGAVAARASETLPTTRSHLSAKGVVDRPTSWILALALIGALCSLCSECRTAVDVIGAVFFAAMTLRACICAAGVARSTDTSRPLADVQLPSYTVLVALHKEAAMVPSLVSNLKALRYPAEKMEVLFLIEADDRATRLALASQPLPPNFRIIVVPDGKPRTKPRALNVGLMLARGECVTVYDAEDHPDPDQLCKAAARFASGPDKLVCLQGRLAMGNATAGFLPKMFATEYAALFDLLNVGSDRLELPIAIGGTSNHFKTSILREVGGWDAWNVTEDADLGLRLARFGYAVGDLDSTTGETAPDGFGIWFRQRQRWTKGWMQTLLVLARDATTVRDFGIRRTMIVALLLTSLVTGPLLTPFAVVFALFHLCVHGVPRPQGAIEICEATLATSVFALGIASTMWQGYVGARARALPISRVSLPLFVLYQLLISVAAWGGLWDLVRRPYHWRKTPHQAPAEPQSFMARKAAAAANDAPASDTRLSAPSPRNGVANWIGLPIPIVAAETPKMRAVTQSHRIRIAIRRPPRRSPTVSAAPTAPSRVKAAVLAASEAVV